MTDVTALASTSPRRNILVVDDEEGVCRSVQKVLGRKGYTVEKALGVSGAVDLLEDRGGFDLVITDLMMPQISGFELLKIVKGSWPESRVLVITGYGSISSAVEATRLGAVGYIPKPFTPEELEGAVEGALSGKAQGAVEAATSSASSGVIDVDLPFDAQEVEQATSKAYVEHLTRSDLPMVPTSAPAPPLDYCAKGARTCKRYARRGVCQHEECPIVVAEAKRAGHLLQMSESGADLIDVDMPFSFSEVAAATCESYALALGPSDLPVVGHWREVPRRVQAPRILVVDDEAVVVNSIRKTLTRRGYQIEEAFNGREAYARLKNEVFDLVLLDMKLPDIHGLDLLSRIRKMKPNLRVLMVTGYASIDTAVEAIRRGADDYVAKPFTPEELYQFTGRYVN